MISSSIIAKWRNSSFWKLHHDDKMFGWLTNNDCIYWNTLLNTFFVEFLFPREIKKYIEFFRIENFLFKCHLSRKICILIDCKQVYRFHRYQSYYQRKLYWNKIGMKFPILYYILFIYLFLWLIITFFTF